MAVVLPQATVNVSQYPQARRLHPFVFGLGTVAATPGVDVGEAPAYGTVMGAAMAVVLPQATVNVSQYPQASRLNNPIAQSPPRMVSWRWRCFRRMPGPPHCFPGPPRRP
eukprot:EG_transcript_32978